MSLAAIVAQITPVNEIKLGLMNENVSLNFVICKKESCKWILIILMVAMKIASKGGKECRGTSERVKVRRLSFSNKRS